MAKHLYYGQPINWGHPLNRGLVSRWQVVPWYASGPRLINLASQKHGTLTNGPKWSGAVGRPGGYGSLTFAGAGAFDRVNLGSVATVNGTAWTVALWFLLLPGGAGRGTLFGNRGQASSRDIRFNWRTANRLTVGEENVAYIADNNTDLVTNVWYHFAWTHNANSHNLYLNGKADGSATYTITASYSGDYLISDDTASDDLTGRVDAMNVYDRALSASDVSALYLDESQGGPQSLNWYTKRTYFGVAAATPNWFDGLISQPINLNNRVEMIAI